jgi:hypothetical protein
LHGRPDAAVTPERSAGEHESAPASGDPGDTLGRLALWLALVSAEAAPMESHSGPSRDRDDQGRDDLDRAS